MKPQQPEQPPTQPKIIYGPRGEKLRVLSDLGFQAAPDKELTRG